MGLFGICQLTLIPVRKEPSERSEMVSQLLFGETFDILEEKDNWSHINTHFDHYQGWITSKMATMLDKEGLTKYQETDHLILKEPIANLLLSEPSLPITWLAGGSDLIKEKSQIISGNHKLTLESKIMVHSSSSKTDIPVSALKYLNAPYLWGGRTIFGIDCSGFTQIVFKMNGITLPRDAYQQAELGLKIGSVEDSGPGDVAFFEKPDGYIVHTGIILENSEIIHASGKVRIDKIDDDGIYNRDDKCYTHKLKIIKRIV